MASPMRSGNVMDGVGGGVVLGALANAAEAMITFARAVGSDPAVLEVRRETTPRVYRSGAVFELYVDVELACGVGLAWWLDVTWSDTWVIQPSLRLATADGEESVELAERFATDETEFASDLAGAVRDLLDTRRHIDLWEPTPFFLPRR